MYRQWFDYADADNDGRLTGDDAVKFFSLSQLPKAELKQVWAIADVKRQGFLGFKEFVSAMQVISPAQSGKDVSPNMLKNADLESISAPTMAGLEELIEKRQQRTPSSSNGSFRSNGASLQKSQTSQWFNQKTPRRSLSSVISHLNYRRLEETLYRETEALGSNLPFQRLRLSYTDRERLRCKAPGDASGPILNRQNDFHQASATN
jgi:hypothetical protein